MENHATEDKTTQQPETSDPRVPGVVRNIVIIVLGVSFGLPLLNRYLLSRFVGPDIDLFLRMGPPTIAMGIAAGFFYYVKVFQDELTVMPNQDIQNDPEKMRRWQKERQAVASRHFARMIKIFVPLFLILFVVAAIFFFEPLKPSDIMGG